VFLDAERRRRGVPRLSPRETEVLRLAALGRSNADIARTLFVSVSTVRKHMEHVFDRTGVRSRADDGRARSTAPAWCRSALNLVDSTATIRPRSYFL
jgi:DNA-binding CsgD family transcriptional regulator